MKPENRSLIRALLEESDSITKDIYEDSEKMLGSVPFILRVMSRRPEFMIFSALKDFHALRPDSLDARTAELLAVAAAAGAGADKCLRLHMRAASRAGATDDQILDAILIAAMIGQTRVLAMSLRAFQEFEAGPEEAESSAGQKQHLQPDSGGRVI